MAIFELSTSRSDNSYEERLEITLRLTARPDQADYQSTTEAINTLNNIYEKYRNVPAEKPEVTA